MFHLSSLSGRLESSEVLNLCRSNQVTPFLTSQHDLLSVPQPGLFLVDNEHEVLMWQGAWPEQAEGEGSAVTGSAQSRFVADRRLAMELCLEYCQGLCGACGLYVLFASVLPYITCTIMTNTIMINGMF